MSRLETHADVEHNVCLLLRCAFVGENKLHYRKVMMLTVKYRI